MSNMAEDEAGWSDLELDYDYDPYVTNDPAPKAKEFKTVHNSPIPEEQVNIYSQGIRDPMSIVFSLMNKTANMQL